MVFRSTVARFYRLYKYSTPLTDIPVDWRPGVDTALKKIEKEVCWAFHIPALVGTSPSTGSQVYASGDQVSSCAQEAIINWILTWPGEVHTSLSTSPMQARTLSVCAFVLTKAPALLPPTSEREVPTPDVKVESDTGNQNFVFFDLKFFFLFPLAMPWSSSIRYFIWYSDNVQ